jgi:hypothetical protein
LLSRGFIIACAYDDGAQKANQVVTVSMGHCWKLKPGLSLHLPAATSTMEPSCLCAREALQWTAMEFSRLQFGLP